MSHLMRHQDAHQRRRKQQPRAQVQFVGPGVHGPGQDHRAHRGEEQDQVHVGVEVAARDDAGHGDHLVLVAVPQEIGGEAGLFQARADGAVTLVGRRKQVAVKMDDAALLELVAGDRHRPRERFAQLGDRLQTVGCGDLVVLIGHVGVKSRKSEVRCQMSYKRRLSFAILSRMKHSAASSVAVVRRRPRHPAETKSHRS